ncbi:MAG: diaminopimelate epimerase [Actinomycetota bacterium]|nr:diaminopimelate epimerase [Actinomycetota bacterium]MDA8209909.1 diaminopimelate epimerase [Actinomycetota bacterium]
MAVVEEFYKLEGLGNDFLVAFCPELFEPDPSAVIRLLDRRLGIGADGLILAVPTGTASLAMALYNSDGTRAEMSGNGIRCLGHAAYATAQMPIGPIEVSTDAGPRRLSPEGYGASGAMLIEAEMGKVSYVSPPFARTGFFAGRKWRGTELEVGNPHLVFLPEAGGDAGERLAEIEIAALGPEIEAGYPAGTNVEWVELDSPALARLRVWERGAGVTLACGTGSTAAAFLLLDQGLAQGEVEVRNPGGTLWARRGEAGEMYLRGPSTLIATVTVAEAFRLAR